MRLRPLPLLAALLLPLLAAPALAQPRAHSWELGPYFNFTDFDSATEIQDDVGLGFRFGYNFVPMHEMEFSFDTLDTEDRVSGQIDVELTKFQVNYVMNLIFQRRQVVVPYFTAGLGLLRYEVSEPGFGSDDETDDLFNVGGGARFFVGKSFNIRLDLRWILYEGDDIVLRSIDYTNTEFSFGVGWILGP